MTAPTTNVPRNRPADFRISGGGTVYLFRPTTTEAYQHLEAHVGGDAQWVGFSLAVEHRYVEDLAARLRADGFTVERE